MRRIREVLLIACAEPGVRSRCQHIGGRRVARLTVRAYLDRATAAGLDAVAADGLSETALEAAALPAVIGHRWSHAARLGRGGSRNCGATSIATRKLLWMDVQGSSDPDGLGVQPVQTAATANCRRHTQRGLSMRRCTTPGETVQVDYAGDDTVVVVDDG